MKQTSKRYLWRMSDGKLDVRVYSHGLTHQKWGWSVIKGWLWKAGDKVTYVMTANKDEEQDTRYLTTLLKAKFPGCKVSPRLGEAIPQAYRRVCNRDGD